MKAERLAPQAEFLLKHARHAGPPRSFAGYKHVKSDFGREDMRSTLNQFLSQESLEEQRINFLASQARIQTSQAAVNYEQD